MQIPLGLQRREHLETDRVRRHGREVVIPQELHNPPALFQPCVLGLALLAVRLLLRVGHGGPGPGEADAQEEDVPALELDAAFVGDGEHVVEGDDVLGECVYGLFSLFVCLLLHP